MDFLKNLFSENPLAAYMTVAFFLVIVVVTVMSAMRREKNGESKFADTYDEELEKIRRKKRN